jgi:hypothetical protein
MWGLSLDIGVATNGVAASGTWSSPVMQERTDKAVNAFGVSQPGR